MIGTAAPTDNRDEEEPSLPLFAGRPSGLRRCAAGVTLEQNTGLPLRAILRAERVVLGIRIVLDVLWPVQVTFAPLRGYDDLP